MLATQRRSELAGNQPVHELHALDVPCVGHDLKEDQRLPACFWPA
jgi:hypothetical protein